MLPFTYAIRNLTRSWTKTIQVIIGSALVILVIVAAASFNRAMFNTISATGDNKNVMLIGAGSEESIERSEISATITGIVAASIRGLQEKLGQLAVSGEIYYMGLMQNESGSSSEALIRGVELAALQVHSKVAITSGNFPGPGEVMVGRLTSQQMGWTKSELAIGRKISMDGQEFTVSGTFEAPGSVMEAEIWMNLSDLMTITQRDSLSCVTVTLDKAEYEDIDLFCKQRLDLELSAVRESDYYNKLSQFYTPIKLMVWLTAILIASGAIFGGLNTMYAAFISRRKELATLQAVGYSRRAIMVSLLQESFLLNLLASLLAMTVALFVLDGFELSFASGVFSLNIDNYILMLAIITAAALSIIGMLIPGWNCLKPSLVSSLRSI